jgi:hypothetical protein
MEIMLGLGRLSDELPDKLKENIRKKIAIVEEGKYSSGERSRLINKYFSEYIKKGGKEPILYAMFLTTVFGLGQEMHSQMSSYFAETFPEIKKFRNHGIKQYNTYRREATDLKLQNILDENVDIYIKQDHQDLDGTLNANLEYLEKARKVNTMAIKQNFVVEEALSKPADPDNSKKYDEYIADLVNESVTDG